MKFQSGCQGGAVISAEAVGEECERALGDDFRVELFEGTGGGVAGVGEGRQARLVAFGVHRGEGGVRHENFAAHFEDGWEGGGRILDFGF